MLGLWNSFQLERAAKAICDLAIEFLKSLEVRAIEEVGEPLEQERAQGRGVKNAPESS